MFLHKYINTINRSIHITKITMKTIIITGLPEFYDQLHLCYGGRWGETTAKVSVPMSVVSPKLAI